MAALRQKARERNRAIDALLAAQEEGPQSAEQVRGALLADVKRLNAEMAAAEKANTENAEAIKK
jgi:hypothetical protein